MANLRRRQRLTVIVAAEIVAAGSDTPPDTTVQRSVFTKQRTAFVQCVKNSRGSLDIEFRPHAMAAFRSVGDALGCVHRARNNADQHNEEVAQHNRLYFRFGVHIDEIDVDVSLSNTAAAQRAIWLAGNADVGGMAVSDAIYRQASKERESMELRELATEGEDGSPRIYVLPGVADAEYATKCVIQDQHDAGSSSWDDGRHRRGGGDDTTIANMLETPVSADVTVLAPADPQEEYADEEILDDTKAEDEAVEKADKACKAAEKYLADDKPYYAIENYDTAIDVLSEFPDQRERVSKLMDARKSVDEGLRIADDPVLEISDQPIQVRIGTAFEIGRRDRRNLDEIHVGCKLISRIGRQAKITFENDAFRVTDLNSTNGTFVGDAYLEPGSSAPIDGSVELRFGGGRNPPKPGLCILGCEQKGTAPPALSMGFYGDTTISPTQANFDENWQSKDADCRFSWVLTPGPLLIGGTDQCAIRLPDVPETVLAEITYDDGYVVTPRAKDVVTINGARVLAPVRLSDGAEVNFADCGAVVRVYSNKSYFEMRYRVDDTTGVITAV